MEAGYRLIALIQRLKQTSPTARSKTKLRDTELGRLLETKYGMKLKD